MERIVTLIARWGIIGQRGINPVRIGEAIDVIVVDEETQPSIYRIKVPIEGSGIDWLDGNGLYRIPFSELHVQCIPASCRGQVDIFSSCRCGIYRGRMHCVICRWCVKVISNLYSRVDVKMATGMAMVEHRDAGGEEAAKCCKNK